VLFEVADTMRVVQGTFLEMLGFGPIECDYDVIATTPYWRLRDYGGSDAQRPLVIVAAPIKRPYIWDLAPSASPVRFLRRRGLRVCLMEWQPPLAGAEAAGLEVYADQAITECVETLSAKSGAAPFVLGHSLGGTLAATFAALYPERISGLVLVGAPLCFQPHSSRFRDAIDAAAPLLMTQDSVVPGSALSQLSAAASPATFIWSRLLDQAFSTFDRRAADTCMRVERWALDEVALPGRLLRQVLQWFYQEDQLSRGTLWLRGRAVGPGTTYVPTLAVVNAADAIAPRESVEPFLDRMPIQDVRLLEFAGETGVGLQHVALLVGPHALAEVWPTIGNWIEAHG
jgi:polyhydroxyalkanoate synthase